MEQIINDIIAIENSWFEGHGKYKYISEWEYDIYKIQVNEYTTPQNQCGYDIVLKKTEDEKEYIKIVSFGVEAEQRAIDWTEIIEDLI